MQTRSSLRATLVALVCVVLTIGTGVPAHADTERVRDKRGDAASAAFDITAVKYQNTPAYYRAVITIPGLKRKPRYGVELMASPCRYLVEECSHEWYAAVGFKRSGAPYVQLYLWEASTYPVECTGIAVRVSGTKVIIRVPSDCVVGNSGPGGPKLRMKATAYVMRLKPLDHQVPSIAAYRKDAAPQRIVRY